MMLLVYFQCELISQTEEKSVRDAVMLHGELLLDRIMRVGIGRHLPGPRLTQFSLYRLDGKMCWTT